MTELPRVGGSISRLAWMGLLGIVFFVVTIVSLHVLQADLKPLDEAMSYYVHGSQGWLPTVGLIGLGIAPGRSPKPSTALVLVLAYGSWVCGALACCLVLSSRPIHRVIRTDRPLWLE